VRKRIEKDTLIKILDCCIEDDCFHCPNAYKGSSIAACEAVARGSVHIPFAIMRETIEALKAQPEEQAIPVDTKVIGGDCGDIEVYCCRACRFQLDPVFLFCPNCGQAVKWDEL